MIIEPRVPAQRRFLPMRYASLCLNDETIFDLRDLACPTCGSRTIVLLSKWLRDRSQKREW